MAIPRIAGRDLETLLGILDIDVTADTADRYWSADDRENVLNWAAATLADRRGAGPLRIPLVPTVLVPFIEASSTRY